MKKNKVFSMIAILLVFTLLAAACSAKYAAENAAPKADRSSTSYDYDASEPGYTSGTAGYGDAKYEGAKDDVDTEETIINTSTIVNGNSSLQTQDKIIRTFFLDVETQEFDTLISKLDAEISRLNGYVESSRISGKSYLSDRGVRSASITARLPKDNVDEFVNAVGESANVINKQETTENVTLQYTDIESRKKALEIEQERLFALLEKTDSMENIVTLESRLSDIRYELQNYETTLRTYDNKVEYSTVNLSIQEVEILSPKVAVKQTVGSRISNGFSNTIYRISEGFKDFFVWFVVNLPYLLIWGVIIAGLILIARRTIKKRHMNEKTPSTPPKDKEE